MNVLFVPAVRNPYQYLLAQALAPLDVRVQHSSALPSERWLVANRGRVELLHLHWLHTLYNSGRKSSPLYLARFVEKLVCARSLGYKLIWTAHNIMPHERTFPPIDSIGRLAVMIFAHAIIVHCEYAKNEISKRFLRKNGIHVIPLGHYGVLYPYSVPKEEARRTLDIDRHAFVYLFFGKIRPYKGVERLIRAFEQLDDQDVNLLVAGECPEEEHRRRLLHLTQGNGRIRLFLDFVPDEAVQRYFAAADVLVAPFSEVLTSSSVMLALSFGRPVIAPALGCLPELITSQAGVIYDPMNEEALLKALQSIRGRDVETMGREAYRLSRAPDFDWECIAEKTKEIYLNCLSPSPLQMMTERSANPPPGKKPSSC